MKLSFVGKTYTLMSDNGVTKNLIDQCFQRIQDDIKHSYKVLKDDIKLSYNLVVGYISYNQTQL